MELARFWGMSYEDTGKLTAWQYQVLFDRMIQTMKGMRDE